MTKFTTPASPRSKAAAAWMAALLGVFGAHWWYLGRPRAWMFTAFSVAMLVLAQFYTVWWDNPAFLILIIPLTVGYIEALVFALKPDEWFDAKYNPGFGRVNNTGWDAVLAAIATTLFGGTLFVFGIALIVMHVYTAMGWLDGYVF